MLHRWHTSRCAVDSGALPSIHCQHWPAALWFKRTRSVTRNWFEFEIIIDAFMGELSDSVAHFEFPRGFDEGLTWIGILPPTDPLQPRQTLRILAKVESTLVDLNKEKMSRVTLYFNGNNAGNWNREICPAEYHQSRFMWCSLTVSPLWNKSVLGWCTVENERKWFLD